MKPTAEFFGRSSWRNQRVVRCLLKSAWLAFLAVLFSCQRSTENEADFLGLVSAATPEAAAAGVEILEAGGNAVDAAVAVSFALGVTEPAMSGIGGGTQMLIHALQRQPVVINGTSFSPRATPTDVTPSDLREHQATTIPSTVRTLDYAWRTYGSGKIGWARLVEPAIRYAEEGFVVGPFRHKVWKRSRDVLAKNEATRRLFLTPDGTEPAEGNLWKQPVLAQTLRRLAAGGADDFYKGEIAAMIAEDMHASGGWIALEDLRNFPQPVELTPLKGSYRDWDVFTLPPPCGGWVVLQILNLLERSSARELDLNAVTRPFLLAEALRIGHTNRRRHPVKDLIEYSAEVSERTSKETASSLLSDRQVTSGETTHFTVVDAGGMVVSVTASINAYFGSRSTTASLGFLYNSYMHEFESGDPKHPFAIRPNAMPYSSMSATILSKDGRPLLGLGSPGSSRIISSVAQVVQLWVDAGLGVEQAVAARRLHVVPDNKLYIESESVTDSLRAALVESGYTLEQARTDLAAGELNPYFGGVHAVAFENGKWVGAADPRRDGVVQLAKSN